MKESISMNSQSFLKTLASPPLLLEALHGRNQGRVPCWLMRQAGRCLPAYQHLRSKHSLLEMFHHPELIVEITHLPLKVLPLDAAIVFADILTVLDSLNIPWDFTENGPVISSISPTTSLTCQPAQEAYPYIDQAIRELKKTLPCPLLGFAGAPFTLASYLIEGKTTRDGIKTKQWMYDDPVSFQKLLFFLADAVTDYLNLQIEAGVDAIQIFDSWASVLSTQEFHRFCLPSIERILKKLRSVPVILFCRGSSFWAEDLAKLHPTCLSLDWQGNIKEIRKKIPSSISLQGNLDPAVLLCSKETIERETNKILSSMKNDPGYIFNLGHGILPQTPFDHVKFLVDYVHAFSSTSPVS